MKSFSLISYRNAYITYAIHTYNTIFKYSYTALLNRLRFMVIPVKFALKQIQYTFRYQLLKSM